VKRRIRKKRRTRAMIPPAMPPTIGPHFAAGDSSSGSAEEDPDEDVGETYERVENAVGEFVWAGRFSEKGTAGRERESVVEPVGINEAYREAETDASTVH
jgi:hypothetical protein